MAAVKTKSSVPEYKFLQTTAERAASQREHDLAMRQAKATHRLSKAHHAVTDYLRWIVPSHDLASVLMFFPAAGAAAGLLTLPIRLPVGYVAKLPGKLVEKRRTNEQAAAELARLEAQHDARQAEATARASKRASGKPVSNLGNAEIKGVQGTVTLLYGSAYAALGLRPAARPKAAELDFILTAAEKKLGSNFNKVFGDARGFFASTSWGVEGNAAALAFLEASQRLSVVTVGGKEVVRTDAMGAIAKGAWDRASGRSQILAYEDAKSGELALEARQTIPSPTDAALAHQTMHAWLDRDQGRASSAGPDFGRPELLGL